jgi:hypothetical protein
MRHIIAGLLLATGCACLHAQTLDLRATIPFAFRAGEKPLPAGEYIIRYQNGVLILHEDGGQRAAAMLLTSGGPQVHTSKSALEFHRYDERYFLAAVVTPSSPDSVLLLPGRSEREIARGSTPPQTVGVALAKP